MVELVQIQEIETDVLVIGSGGAGLRAAIEARRHGVEVLITDKVVIGTNNNTRFSGGGFKAALPGLLSSSHGNIPETPYAHTLLALEHGEYINDDKLVETLCYQAPGRIIELKEFGIVPFGHPFGHLSYRVPYPHGTGIVKPLMESINKLGCRKIPGFVVVDLLHSDGKCHGVLGFNIYQKKFYRINAKSTILCTGGAGELFKRNDTTANTTGDGYAIALRAGVPLRDMEIIQFEPYIQDEPGLPAWDRHECEAEFYAILRNKDGEDFLKKYLETKKTVSGSFDKQFGWHLTDIRERVARAMAEEVRAGRGDKGSVLMDLTTIPDLLWQADIASIYTRRVLLRGFDIKKKWVHVYPGAICSLGGIVINEHTETALHGLFAAGEVAGGVHGAARLGGDALTETIVFGAIAGDAAGRFARRNSLVRCSETQVKDILSSLNFGDIGSQPDSVTICKDNIKNWMWEDVGIIRNRKNMRTALGKIEELRGEVVPRLKVGSFRQLKNLLELRNMCLVAETVTRSADTREESRGGHYREDFPYRDDRHWLANILVTMRDGKMNLDVMPKTNLKYIPNLASRFGYEVRS